MSEVPPPPADDSGNVIPSIPGQLRWLTDQEMTVMERSRSGHYIEQSQDERHPRPIAQTAVGRLRSLVRQEARSRQPRIATPSWSREGAIPGLIIAQRYVGGDAFGSARQTAELDAALRRAVALMHLLERGKRVLEWPRPIRPERGGLWLLDARYGSLDLLWTVYGSVVAVATSTPVSLASFTSLAWSSSRSASRMARRWVVRPLEAGELVHRPSAGGSTSSVSHSGDADWHERTTKKLVPLFKQAVSDGRGIDYQATGPSGEVRLIVTPRTGTEAPDEPPA